MGNRLRIIAAASVFGALVALGSVAPATAANTEPEPVATPLTTAQLEAEVAAIPDETQRALVAAHIEKKLAAGAQFYGLAFNSFKPKPASGGVTPMAYPSGCGLTVLISRVGQRIENDSMTSCSSLIGPWTSLTHQSDIVALHGVTGWPKKVADRAFSFGPNSAALSTLTFTCNNYNQTGYNVRTSGRMYKGVTLYTTPLVYDTFGGNINCGY